VGWGWAREGRNDRGARARARAREGFARKTAPRFTRSLASVSRDARRASLTNCLRAVYARARML